MAIKLKTGFTLIELVVVTAIFGVLLTIGTNLLFQVIISSNKATNDAELRQEASKILEIMGREVRKARCITSGLSSVSMFADCSTVSNPATAYLLIGLSGGNIIKMNPSVGASSIVIISTPNITYNLVTQAGPSHKSVMVSITAVRSGARWDKQGSVTEKETFAVRDYN